MDVNVVKLLKNVRNWLYLISRWENGVEILCWLVARSQSVKVGIGILPPYKLHVVLYSGFCCAPSWLIESCRIMVDYQKETSCLLSSLWDEECRVHQ